MKKLIHICVLALTVFCLAGCSESIPDKTTVSLDKTGKVVCTYVEEFGKDFYNEAELQGEIEAEIENYNKKFDTAHLNLELFLLEEGSVKMQLAFDEAKYYADYTGLDFFVGTVAEAKDAGYNLDGEFLDPEGSLTDLSLLSNGDQSKTIILALDEDMQVEIPGKLLCVTPTSNVEIRGRNLVSVSEIQQVCIIYE